MESERWRAAEEPELRSDQVVEVAGGSQVITARPGPQLEECEIGVDSRGKRGREGWGELGREGGRGG